ncbi:DNA cytosine methyltransferase [Catenulispora yoronensis]
MPLLHQALDDLAAGYNTIDRLTTACSDPRTPLVVQPLRYALDLRPEWVTLEQVPAVLPLWQHIVRILRGRGYSGWAGVLNAADYGVPQTRRRAILIASRIREVAPPEPTHAQVPEEATLFGPARIRWVSMAEALGWDTARVVNTRGARTTPGGNEFPVDQPSWALTEKARSWTVDVRASSYQRGYERTLDRPSPTLMGQTYKWMLRNNTQANSSARTLDEPAGTLFFGARGNDVSWVAGRPATTLAATGRVAKAGHRDREGGERQFEDAVRITIEEASVLQSFRPDYPWQGPKTRKFLQIGNAVPPLLALHVLAAATGIDPADAPNPSSVHT